MTVNFPNASRSYDSAHRVIHFWGYDRSMEKSFSVTTEALRRIDPTIPANEAGFLGAFDRHRERIYATALKIYGLGRTGSYELVAANF